MAAEEDAKALQKRVYKCSNGGVLAELTALLEEHPEVDVDGYNGTTVLYSGRSAFFRACMHGHTECAQLLIDHKADVNTKDINGVSALCIVAQRRHLRCVKLLVQNGADVNCQSDSGRTPLISSAFNGNLTTAQYLLEHKADVHYRAPEKVSNKNRDALYCAMRKRATNRTPGFAFAFLCCNTDAKNVKIQYGVTITIRDAHIETYSHVQAFIDEYHRILTRVLSGHVQVDTRVGRGDNGIYQEPLERALEYLGLSMSKDRVVNASIDGEEQAAKRALIPGHLLSANHWFDKHTSR
jgi:ankyrin repeat protein